jgi:hypothetical protein
VHITLSLTIEGFLPVRVKLGDGDGGQNAYNRYNNEQFDQRKTLFPQAHPTHHQSPFYSICDDCQQTFLNSYSSFEPTADKLRTFGFDPFDSAQGAKKLQLLQGCRGWNG